MEPARTGLRASVRGTFFSSWIAARATLSTGGVQDTIAPRFALWDAFVSQRIRGGLSAFVSVDNLTDSQDPNTGVLLPTGAPAAIYRPGSHGARWRAVVLLRQVIGSTLARRLVRQSVSDGGSLERRRADRSTRMLTIRTVLPVLVFTLLVARTSFADPGILLLAHGGSAEWNGRVTELAAKVNATRPTEVAFGMATRATIQSAVDKLVARGVTEIVAVPLFVSSWSTVITSTEYLLGLRAEAPAALANYAKMNHAPAGTSGSAAAGHEGHTVASDGTTPVKSRVPVRMTPALNDHPIVADILASRARAISRDATKEALIIVAHGPNEEDDNRRWLIDMGSLAARLKQSETFASLEYLTLRDDAPKPVRDAATAQLRGIVERELSAGRRVLIVPLLISFGGIERGLRERLEGLPYTMAEAALMPDDRLATWVLTMASSR
jgi:sirohydrochlorin ferrochelatase